MATENVAAATNVGGMPKRTTSAAGYTPPRALPRNARRVTLRPRGHAPLAAMLNEHTLTNERANQPEQSSQPERANRCAQPNLAERALEHEHPIPYERALLYEQPIAEERALEHEQPDTNERAYFI